MIYLSGCSIRKKSFVELTFGCFKLNYTFWFRSKSISQNHFESCIFGTVVKYYEKSWLFAISWEFQGFYNFCRYYAFHPYHGKRHLAAENHNFWAKNHIIYCKVKSRWIHVFQMKYFTGYVMKNRHTDVEKKYGWWQIWDVDAGICCFCHQHRFNINVWCHNFQFF